MAPYPLSEETCSLTLERLLKGEYEALETYHTALRHLNNLSYRIRLLSFMEDHDAITENLTNFLKIHGSHWLANAVPDSTSWADWAVLFASLGSDHEVLHCVSQQEDAMRLAYEKADYDDMLWPTARKIVEQGLADTRRHWHWLEGELSKI